MPPWRFGTVTLFLLVLALPVWGIGPSTALKELPYRLTVAGKLDGEKWSRQVSGTSEILTFECSPKSGCYSHPSSADFYFRDGHLVSGTLRFSREMGPETQHLAQDIQKKIAPFGKPLAVGQSVGRYTRYYSTGGMTIAWVQDGDQAQVKLYVDKANPMGRAEAVALGAKLDLSDYPGAAEYQIGYRALLKEDWAAAIASFQTVLRSKNSTPAFREQVQFVVAMAIAASLKAEFKKTENRTPEWLKTAAIRIADAKANAPRLKTQLDALFESFRAEIP